MAKEIIDKVMKTLKNDGTFGNLVRRAVTELEEEGFMDQLRTEGKEHSDEIFRKYFPSGDAIIDMTRELKQSIMQETKDYATTPEIQKRIDNKVSEMLTLQWVQLLTWNKIEDEVRKEMDLPPIPRVKEEEQTDDDEYGGRTL